MNYERIIEKKIARLQNLEQKIKDEEYHLNRHYKDWQTKVQWMIDKSDLQEQKKNLAILEYKADLERYK